MVQGQQPCTECQQDQGAHRGLQEPQRDPLPHQLRWDTGGNHQLPLFPGTTDFRQPSVDPQHGGHAQEGTPAPLPPTVPQEMRHKPTMACDLLLWHYREHSVRWCHCGMAIPLHRTGKSSGWRKRSSGVHFHPLRSFGPGVGKWPAPSYRTIINLGTNFSPPCGPVAGLAAFEPGQVLLFQEEREFLPTGCTPTELLIAQLDWMIGLLDYWNIIGLRITLDYTNTIGLLLDFLDNWTVIGLTITDFLQLSREPLTQTV